MEQSFAELGWIGIFIFMTFQYVIKPLIAYLIDKRRPDPCEQCRYQTGEIYKIFSLVDDKQRPVVWGFHIVESTELLVGKIDDLIEQLKEG